MSLDLNKLENKLDEALSNETSESLNRFLNDKRMSNKQQTAVEWFLDQLIEHRIIIVDKTTYQVKYKHEIFLEQAKEMEKGQIKKAVNFGDERGNIVSYSTAEQYYNETYGGGEQ